MTSTSISSPVAPPFAGYHHMGITVRDIAASEGWYTRVLGLERAFVEPHHNGTGYAVVMTRPGTGFLLGLDHHENADRELFDACRTGLDHLAFRLDTRAELDNWVAHLDALGIGHDRVTESTEPMPLALVVFHDPDGVPLELIWLGSAE